MDFRKNYKKLFKVSIIKFIYYNFFCRKIVRKGKGFLMPYRHCVINLAKGAEIIIHDGNFTVNYFAPAGSKSEAYVKMGKGAKLEITGWAALCYKSTIEIHENAIVTIGSAYINTGAVILAAKKITIGNGVLISREVFIFDSDHHPIIDSDGKQVNLPRPVEIEDHVWLGLKCILLRGSRIGTGAIIAAGSVVGGKIKAGTMASGNPARSYNKVNWKGSL